MFFFNDSLRMAQDWGADHHSPVIFNPLFLIFFIFNMVFTGFLVSLVDHGSA